MDLGSALLSICLVMLSVLGAARSSNGDKTNCPCPEIPQMNLTESPPRTCFTISSTFRYTCISGYVRRAGTSNLTKCKQTDSTVTWTTPSLQCIPDPKIVPPSPPSKVIERPTDIRPDSVITTTVTAASTSQQMTQSKSSSASVTTKVTERTEPTSPGLQVLSDHSQGFVKETKAPVRTTPASTTSEPSDSRTIKPLVSDRTELSNTSAAMIALASLVFVSTLIGLAALFYRRRSKRNIRRQPAEEQLPMNGDPSAPAL